MKVTILTRTCVDCNSTYRARPAKTLPSCPNCSSTLSVVIASRETNDPALTVTDHRHLVEPVTPARDAHGHHRQGRPLKTPSRPPPLPN